MVKYDLISDHLTKNKANTEATFSPLFPVLGQ